MRTVRGYSAFVSAGPDESLERLQRAQDRSGRHACVHGSHRRPLPSPRCAQEARPEIRTADPSSHAGPKAAA